MFDECFSVSDFALFLPLKENCQVVNKKIFLFWVRKMGVVTMKSSQELTKEIVKRFRERGVSRVPGYNRFGYISESDSAVYVSRERGQNTRIPFSKIEQVIKAVRKDTNVYSKGPSALRSYGITHINSPVWSLLHFLSLDEIIE